MINAQNMGPPGIGIPQVFPEKIPRPGDLRGKADFKDVISKSKPAVKSPPGERMPEIKNSPKKNVQEFMDSFEGEFGITPTRLAGAMKELSTEELQKPPTETAEAVIGQLNLSSEDEEKALDMYLQFLLQMQNQPTQKPLDAGASDGAMALQAGVLAKVISDQNANQQNLQEAKISSSAAAGSSQKNISALSQIQDSGLSGSPLESPASTASQSELNTLEELQQRLEKLNESMDGLSAKSLTSSQDLLAQENFSEIQPTVSKLNQQQGLMKYKDQASEVGVQQNILFEENVGLNANKKIAQELAANGEVSPELLSLNSEPILAKDKLSDLATNTSALDLESAKSFEKSMEKGFENNSGFQQSSQEAMIPNEMNLQNEDLADAANSFKLNANAEGAEKSTNTSGVKKTSSASEKSVKMESLDNLTNAFFDSGKNEFKTEAGVAVGGTAAALGQDKDSAANVKNIIDQARYMVTKGGGEVSVKMTPEGMGDIHLKVSIENGKVSMHMSAATDEVKKALEGSLGDLKNSLANHQIQLDNVKIDVGGASNADNQMQKDFGQQGEMGRENARQFLQQFREENLAQRQSNLFDMQGASFPRNKPRPIGPLDRSDANEKARSYGIKKGSGLNIVA